MKKFFTFLMLLCLIHLSSLGGVSAQVTGTIGAGTATTSTIPVNTNWGYTYSQQIYTAAQLTAAIGNTNLVITKIRFYVSADTSPGIALHKDWKVFMTNTNKANFASTTDWIPLSSMTNVFDAQIPNTVVGTWVELNLSSPFVWDGTSNIAIAVDENTPDYDGIVSWGAFASGTNSAIYYYSDITNPDPAAPPTASGRTATIPRLQLVAEPLQPCTTASPNNISVGGLTPTSATVSWLPSLGATYTVRYRISPSGAWTTINNATYPLTIPGLSELTTYDLQIATTCGGTTGAFSTSTTFTTPAISYCSANSTSTTLRSFISNVTVNSTGTSFMSSTSGSSLYTDYTTDPTRLVTFVRGSTGNTISVTKNWPGTIYSTSASAWIDWNRNGTFETTEKVMGLGASTTTPVVSPAFTVPTTAYNGTLPLRMRVISSETSSPAACGTFTYGEVEDYYVKIIDLPNCTTAAPTGINVSSITINSATVSWNGATGATYLIRYKLNSSGVWSADIPVTPAGANSYTITGLQEATLYDVQVRTVCNGTTGPYSTTRNFTTASLAYCNAGSTSTTVTGYISNVLVEPQGSNVMSSNSGYSTYTDYTTDATRLIRMVRTSTTNKITVTKFWPGTTSSMGVGVWIDWNRNGTFEAGEKVYTGANNTTAVSASPNNIAVPATAYTGTLPIRMRVVLQSGGASNACGTFTNGEVEDYNIVLIDQPACTTAPPAIMVSNLSPTSATASWIAASNAIYNVRYRQQGTTAWLPSTAGQTLAAGVSSYVMTPLTESTTYEVQVQTVCNGTAGAFSASTIFTTPPLTYCYATSLGATAGFISNVTVTPNTFPVMSNTTGAGTYTSYTNAATLIDLFVGSTGNSISVDKSWPVAPGTAAGVGVWIDFNRDGDFNDPGEKILNSGSSTTTPVTASFTVPATAYTGPLTTTMRVIMRQGGSPNPCDVFPLGEVEDYRVRIRVCDTTTPTAVTINTITDTSASVTWTPGVNNLTYIVEYRVLGSGGLWTQSPIITAIPYDLTGLTPATTYEVRIVAVCGTNYGSYTTPVEFTTMCDPAAPFVSVNQITPYTAVVNWTTTANASYVLRYRKVGDPAWPTPGNPGYVTIPAGTTSYAITNLTPYTKYEVQVASICTGTTVVNPWSTSSVFTTERLCEMPPPGLTILNITPTTAEVTWDPYPGASYKLRYRKVGIPSWTEIVTNTNIYMLTGLLESTKYEMQVANICSGTTGTFSDPYYFTTPTIIYCAMSSGSAANGHISKVIVKPNGRPTLTNPSGASTYSDFTTVTTTNPPTYIELIQGSTDNEITVEKTLAGTATKAGIAAWIDFNRNGIFEPEERIFAQGPDATTPVKGTFNVPVDAFVSMTDYKYVVLRVAMQKDGIPVNCVNFDDGEVEDYTVRIIKPGGVTPSNNVDFAIYPNPVHTVLNFKNAGTIPPKYKMYNAAGQLLGNARLINKNSRDEFTLDVSRLVNGVYIIDVEYVIDGKTLNAKAKFIKE